MYIGNEKLSKAYFLIDKFSNLMLDEIPKENFVTNNTNTLATLFYEKSFKYSKR